MARFFIFASLFCAAFASPWRPAHMEAEQNLHRLAKRDESLTIVTNALYNISNYTVALGYVINNFAVDITVFNNLTAQKNNVLGAIAAGISAASDMANLTTTDVIDLEPILDQLTKTVNTTVQDTITQKTAFGGLGSVILAGLYQQSNATADFQAAVAAKIATDLVPAVEAANAPIVSSLALGISIFETPNVNTDKSVYSSDATIGVTIKHVGVMMGIVLGGMLLGTGLIW